MIVVHIEEIFDILQNIHVDNNHCKTAKLHKLTSERYYNITRETVVLFLSLCDCCPARKEREKRTAPKPVLNVKKLNGKAWVTFLNQKCLDNLRYIMIYTEWSSKFCHLRAIEDLNPSTIALALVEILTGFGSPYIMYFDVEKDQQEQILNELSSIFPAKIVLGEENSIMLQDMMKEREVLKKKLTQFKTIPWPISIKLIQYELNKAEIHQNVTPYEALFGVKMNQNGRNSVNLSADLIDQIFNGEYKETEGSDILC